MMSRRLVLLWACTALAAGGGGGGGTGEGPGSIIFMDNTGLNIVDLGAKKVRHVLDFKEPCKGRGIGVDTSLEVVLWSCDDRKLHSTHYNAQNPIYEDFTTTEKYLKTGVVTDNKGHGFYSEFQGIGWRVWKIDLLTGITESSAVLNVLADQDYGGGLTYFDDTEYISYHRDNLGQIAYTKPGLKSDNLDGVKEKWIEWQTDDPIGYPCELGNSMIVPRMKEKETILLRVDVKDIFPPAVADLHLPPYDTFQGEDRYNRQPAIVLTDPYNVAYTNGSKMFMSPLFRGGDPELVLDLGKGNIFGPIAYIPPPEKTPHPATEAPRTAAPETPVPEGATSAPQAATTTAGPSGTLPEASPMPMSLPSGPGSTTPQPEKWEATPFDSQLPLPPSDSALAQSQDGSEDKDDAPWPLGSGRKWPSLVFISGVLACVAGGMAVLLASKAPESELPDPVQSANTYGNDMKKTESAYAPLTDSHSDKSLSSASVSRPQIVALDLEADVETIITKDQFDRLCVGGAAAALAM